MSGIEPGGSPTGISEDEAVAIARRAHLGQLDKGGAPYLGHPLRVMESFSDGIRRIVAVLHDTVEDGLPNGVTLATIAEAGASPVVLAAIDALSRREGELDEEYWARVAADGIAREVKLADLTDNSDPVRLARIGEPKRSELTAKYVRARAFFAVP